MQLLSGHPLWGVVQQVHMSLLYLLLGAFYLSIILSNWPFCRFHYRFFSSSSSQLPGPQCIWPLLSVQCVDGPCGQAGQSWSHTLWLQRVQYCTRQQRQTNYHWLPSDDLHISWQCWMVECVCVCVCVCVCACSCQLILRCCYWCRYFDRDVACVASFFQRRFGYESELRPSFSDVV